MKPAAFQYHAPKTIEEAVATLARVAGEDGRVLAGGQSLVPIMAFRLARPAHLVDINGVEALRRLAVDGDRLSIGACVRHSAFHRPPVAIQAGCRLNWWATPTILKTARYLLQRWRGRSMVRLPALALS